MDIRLHYFECLIIGMIEWFSGLHQKTKYSPPWWVNNEIKCSHSFGMVCSSIRQTMCWVLGWLNFLVALGSISGETFTCPWFVNESIHHHTSLVIFCCCNLAQKYIQMRMKTDFFHLNSLMRPKKKLTLVQNQEEKMCIKEQVIIGSVHFFIQRLMLFWEKKCYTSFYSFFICLSFFCLFLIVRFLRLCFFFG